MNLPYSEITDAIKSMTYNDKIELQSLIHHYLIEERRDEISFNSQQSASEMKEGKLKFYSSLDELKKALKND